MSIPPEITPPPPDALRQKLGAIAPVQTRRPSLALLVVAAIVLAWGAHPFLFHRLRPDLAWLPVWWLVVAGAAWLMAFAVTLRASMMPPAGQVLPDGRGAERIAFVVALGVVAVTSLLGREAPGHSLDAAPGQFWIVAWHCVRFSLYLGGGVIVVVLIALRRMIRWVSWRLGAAIGAAGGALGGLSLHFLCGYASRSHVTLGHAGGLVAGALLGALVARVISR